MTEVQPCKFGGVECTWSERARADCFVCPAVRAKLSALGRLEREYHEMRRKCEELEARNEQLRIGLDLMAEERDKACHKLSKLQSRLVLAAD